MKVTLVILLFSNLFFFVNTVSFGQNGNIKKNTIEIYPNICHYFDGTKVNWGFLVYNPRTKKKIIPGDFGLQFTRKLDKENSLRFSAYTYNMGYDLEKEKKPGEIIERHHNVFSVGYLRRIYTYKKFNADMLGELTFRHGNELQFVSKYFFESVVKSTRNYDVGVGSGIKLNQALVWNFNLFAEADYTYFIYRFDKGNSPNWPIDVGASKQMMTLKAGFGYSF